MTIHLAKWVPFRLAWTLPTLRKGSLNIGNDAQNKQHLLTLAIAQANSVGKNGTASTGWACWRAGFGGTNNAALGLSATSGAGLLINVQSVPGYTPPAGTND